MKCPTGLKVNLLPHQRYSIQWLKWREKNYPNGSILADDMGLGKTLTILSYLKLMKDERENAVNKMKGEEEANVDEDDDDDDKKKKLMKKYISNKYRVKRLKTLIIVPASLMLQWEGEIKSKFHSESFKYHKYHEANRKKLAYNLEDNDIVFTTYEIISREIKLADKDGEERPSDSPLARIKWKRIILDEAHRIKNHSTKANKSICLLRAKYRIAITGTPIHNSIMDLYSLVKFLHFSPLDDITLWKYIFASETFSSTKSSQSANAVERQKRSDSWLAFLADYLILRRCKNDTLKSTGKKIVDLPTKEIEIVRFRLNMSEDAIYQKIFKESKEKVKTFLLNQQQRLMGRSAASTNAVSEIFVYLLRLRQACCHMSLLGECLDKDELQNIKLEAQGIDGLMENMSLNDTDMSAQNKLTESLDKSSDLTLCLNKTYVSSKLDKLLQMVETVLEENADDKLIIVSQWTSMLSIIAKSLRDRDVDYCEIKGEILLFKRNEIVEEFNDENNKQKRVMLLSLTAGGVGLNLVGANHMFLLDIHWNPALEQQCSDRIYRVGQTKNVKIYRFLCENTIEERIEQIQHLKIGLAQKVCGDAPIGGGARTNSAKLTVKDFKLLFQDFDNTASSTQL
jgi:transcription termination factor 2